MQFIAEKYGDLSTAIELMAQILTTSYILWRLYNIFDWKVDDLYNFKKETGGIDSIWFFII